VAVQAIFAFTTMTLLATLLHFDRFHFISPEPIAQAAAWFWLAIYGIVPPVMLVVWIRQLRLRRGDPQRQAPLRISVRLVLGLQSVFTLAVGVALFVQPPTASFR